MILFCTVAIDAWLFCYRICMTLLIDIITVKDHDHLCIDDGKLAALPSYVRILLTLRDEYSP